MDLIGLRFVGAKGGSGARDHRGRRWRDQLLRGARFGPALSDRRGFRTALFGFSETLCGSVGVAVGK